MAVLENPPAMKQLIRNDFALCTCPCKPSSKNAMIALCRFEFAQTPDPILSPPGQRHRARARTCDWCDDAPSFTPFQQTVFKSGSVNFSLPELLVTGAPAFAQRFRSVEHPDHGPGQVPRLPIRITVRIRPPGWGGYGEQSVQQIWRIASTFATINGARAASCGGGNHIPLFAE